MMMSKETDIFINIEIRFCLFRIHSSNEILQGATDIFSFHIGRYRNQYRISGNISYKNAIKIFKKNKK